MGANAIEPIPGTANGMELVAPHVSDPLWEAEAVCRTQIDRGEISMGRKRFTAEDLAMISANCARCPVRSDCLADALIVEGELELQGGTDPKPYKIIRGGYLPAHRKQFIDTIRKRGGIRRYIWEALVEGREPIRPELPQTESTQTDLKLSA